LVSPHINAVSGRHPHFRDPADPVESRPMLIDGKFLMIGDTFTN
jgi:hypothetical protein